MFRKDSEGRFVYPVVLQVVRSEAPIYNRSLSGYGAKLPTCYNVLVSMHGKKARFYRVYCAIFSNIGTCYICSKKENYIVDFEGSVAS